MTNRKQSSVYYLCKLVASYLSSITLILKSKMVKYADPSRMRTDLYHSLSDLCVVSVPFIVSITETLTGNVNFCVFNWDFF